MKVRNLCLSNEPFGTPFQKDPYKLLNKTPLHISINPNKNHTVEFLWNKVANIVEQNKVPASYYWYKIELPRATEDVLEQLRMEGIHWRTVKNKKS